MTDQPDLASLTIKDLRQLAGEHHIQNRSRLDKEQLLQALQEVLAGRGQQLLAAEGEDEADAPENDASSAEAAPDATGGEAAAPVAEANETNAAAPTGTDENDDEMFEDEEPLPAGLPSVGNAEPEVLDAAAVANLTQPGDGDHRRRRRRHRGRGRYRDGDPNGMGPGGPGAPEQPFRHDGQSHPDRPLEQRPESQPPRGPQPGLGRQDQRQDQRPGQRPGGMPDQRPPRPRLEGQQRGLPSVLDRLCAFSRGVLELCDPSTPSWAQSRLSELLAEAGLVQIPAQGQPHPDYHQVVGTVVTRDVPPGYIAVIEAPGFALRGDRGDLFPLRKVQVKLAVNLRNEAAPPAAFAEAPAALAQAPAQISDETAESDELDQADGVSDKDGADLAGHEPFPDGEGSPDPKAPSAAARPTPADRATPSTPFTRNAGESPRERAVAPGHPVRPPPPDQGRPPHRLHAPEPASQAPRLPLAQQDPDQLAARPKAEAFRALGLNDQILADVAALGYSEPLPIQTEGIPLVLAGKDMIGQAQTGTGKTAAFVLPILQRLYTTDDQDGKPVALVLCPTRELARQVHGEFMRMAGASGARACIIYGGVSMDDQIDALERHPHVVIGTPGRIIDHMKRHRLDLSRLSLAVLDEADQMLDIGFWPDVNWIISHTPPTRQMMLFSATFPEPVKLMAEKHMKQPVHIRIAPKQVTVEQVDQKYIAVARERKNELLALFIDTQQPESLLVFCRTKHQTDRVAEVLKRKRMSAGAIHGDLPQTKRERILQQFRSGEIQSLIATNVAARGLDIPIVSHVVNYDIPEIAEEYVHRIGRTARNGAPGVARTFITPDDGQFLLEIEKHIGLLLEEERIEGFTTAIDGGVKRVIADAPVGRLLKPLTGGIRLGRRRRR